MTPPLEPLIDGFGRSHNNLRVSVTDRCNIRCFYCMPEENPAFVERREILSFEEIERFVRVAVRLGVNKVRLTGGEPLVRRGLPALVRKLAAVSGVADLALTTNGLLLPELAGPLFDAGLRRINVHLDTLDAAKFERITRRPGLEQVIDGLFACKRLGYDPIKINAVAVKGLIEDDLAPLARFGANTASRCASSSSCRWTPKACGGGTGCCPPPTSSGGCRGRWPRCRRRRKAMRGRRPANTCSATGWAASASSPRSAGPSA